MLFRDNGITLPRSSSWRDYKVAASSHRILLICMSESYEACAHLEPSCMKDIYTYISKLFYFSSHKIHAHKRNSLKSSLQRWARFFHDSISSTTNDCKTGFKRLASFDPPPFSRRILPRTLYPAIHLATMFPSSGKRREIGNQKRRYYGVKHITECINVGGVS